jgi:hypothetical protein
MRFPHFSPYKQLIALNWLSAVLIVLLSATTIQAANYSHTTATDLNLPDASRLEQLDAYAFSINNSYTGDIKTLAAQLNKVAKTDYERARIIFAWVARNIRYNDAGYNSGNFGNQQVEVVLQTRTSVCDGYARLYKALGEAMGLKVETVSGYAKGFGYTPGKHFATTNHAWNTVYLNGCWRLLDVTWGAGSGKNVNGKLKTEFKYSPYWFDTDPHEFIFTHLPLKPDFQFINQPLTLAQYERMTHVDESLFKLGIEAKELLSQLNSGSLQQLAKTWNTGYDVKIVKAPITGKLQPNKAYDLTFSAPEDIELLVLNNKKWHHFTTSGNKHQLKIAPASGNLAVMARKKGTNDNFSYFIAYKVES